MTKQLGAFVGIGLVLLLCRPAPAFHTVFDFPIDRIEVDGQPFAAQDGTIDLVDDFADGITSPFAAFAGTISESGGMLHLEDPGTHFPGFPIDVSIAFRNMDFASDGGGDVCSTVRWPSDPIPMNSFVIAGLGNGFTSEGILIGLARTDAPTAAATGFPEGLSILRFRFEIPETVAVAIDDGDVTGEIHSRVCLLDATNQAIVSISLDGGGTFLSPFGPTPTFVLGQLTEGMAAGLFTVTTTTTSSSTSSSTSSTSTTSSSTSTSTSSSTSSSSTSSTSSSSSTSTSSTTSSSTSSTTPTTDATTTTTSSTTSSTIPPPLCAPTPATGCRLTPIGASTVHLRDNLDDTKDQLKWKWAKGDATDLADFMDPVGGSAGYGVCIYDASASSQPLAQMSVSPGGTCGTAPCWKAKGTVGFGYKRADGAPDGVTVLKLKSGVAGKANVQAKGKGSHLPMPALPLVPPVTVQLVIADASTTECWQTTYGATIENDATQFKAKGP